MRASDGAVNFVVFDKRGHRFIWCYDDESEDEARDEIMGAVTDPDLPEFGLDDAIAICCAMNERNQGGGEWTVTGSTR